VLVNKFVKAWENQTARRAAKGGGAMTMALTLAACGGSDDTTVVARPVPAPEPTPVPPEVISGEPSVTKDVIVGTSGADEFLFRVAQNLLGEQTNEFATGDQVNGQGGSDILDAIIQAASPLNAGPQQAIMAELTSVETVEFTAIDVTVGGFGNEVAAVSGKLWLGTDTIVSDNSDASLIVYDVNTLSDNQAFGDLGAETGSMTVRMAFTGSNGTTPGSASDMVVLFDDDYLIPGAPVSSESSATFFILDQDGALQGGNNTPLMHKVDANGQVDPAGTTVYFTSSAGISFAIDGVQYSVALTEAQQDAAIGQAAYTFADFVADLNLNLEAAGVPAGVTITLDEANTRTTFLDNGSPFSMPGIVVTSANGGVFSNLGFVPSISPVVEFNEYARFESTDPTTSAQTSINVELLKVGRDGDGGDLLIGGMENDGIQVFNVTVQGRADQPSSLASMASTNNRLEEVYIDELAGSQAALVIGNSETSSFYETLAGTLVPGANGAAGIGVTTDLNNALVDVRILNASGFANDLTVHASLTGDVVAKYMDLVDINANPASDNAVFEYTSGEGNDTFNINISKLNLLQSGTATREDFAMTVETGNGNDSIEMQIGDGAALTQNTPWYANHKLMDANPISTIGIDAGAGDDYVNTWGSTVFRIDAGSGDDVVFSDNSGAEKAQWIFNTADQTTLPGLARNINDVQSDENNVYALNGSTITISYRGVEASYTVAVNDHSTTDLELNNIIKNLVNNHEALGDILVAEDGPGNTLTVTSLIDGEHDVDDFSVSIVAPEALLMSVNTIGDFNSVNGTFYTTSAEVLTHVQGQVVDFDANEDYVSAFTNEQILSLVNNFAGENSLAPNANTITDGTGVDVIVLSTSGLDTETVFLAQDNQADYIFNATNAVINGLGNKDVVVIADGAVGVDLNGSVGDGEKITIMVEAADLAQIDTSGIIVTGTGVLEILDHQPAVA